MSSTKSRLGQVLKRVVQSPWLRVAISAAILGWLFYRMDWQRLVETWRNMRWEWWPGAIGVGIAAQFLAGLRWHTLAKPLGFSDSALRCTGLEFVGLFINLFMPSTLGGDVARAWYLDGGRGFRARAMISVFVEQSSGMAVLFAMALASSLIGYSTFPNWMLPLVLLVCGGFLIGMLSLLAMSKWLSRRLRTARSLWLQGVQHYAETLAEAVAIYWRHRLAFLASLGLAVGMYLLMFSSMWMLSRGLGLSVSLSYYTAIIPLMTLLMWAPISINGIGVREVSLSVFLAPLGVPAAAAVSLGLLSFFNLALISSIGGVIYSLGVYPKLDNEKETEPELSAVV
jgi:glycosyltransferase 2 family protein